MTKLKGSRRSTQIAGNDQMTYPSVVARNCASHGDLLSENVPVKRIRSATTEKNAGEKSSKGWITSKSGFKIHIKFSRKQKHDIVGSEHDLGGELTSSSVNKQIADTSMFAQNSENEQENQIEEAKSDKDCFCDDDRTSNVTKKNASFDPHFTYSPDYLDDNWRKLNLLADVCTTIVESRSSLWRSSCIGDIGQGQPPGDDNNGFSSPKALLCHEKDLHYEKQVINTNTKPTNENLDVDHGQDNEGFPEFRTSNEECNHEITSSKGHDSQEEVSHHEKYDCYSETLQNENADEEHKQDNGIGNVGNHEFSSSKKLIDHEEVLCCEKPDDEPTNVNMDKIEKNILRDFPNIGNAEENVDISIDSEGHHKKETDIARERNGFPFPQSTYAQLCSIATTDLRELKFCVKCNKGGKLLICSSKPCPLLIHERCLGFDARLDAGGRFYCPFCEYSRAISKYENIKKKVSLTRKDFTTFMCSGTRKKLKKQRPRSYSVEQRHLEQDDRLNNKDIPKDTNSYLRKRKVVDSNDGKSHKLDKDKIESKEKKTADAKELSEEENGNSGGSKHFVKVQKRKRKDFSPPIPILRRKSIAWTIAEEETLKEGMQIFFSPHDPYIPWKKILEFGANVFQANRSTIDLKDKWRNLCRASPALLMKF